ncbi:MAG: hypothetical protein M1308_02290 [Actinobacteria bacterium]|nr:hypothetical protein [Actinomycetota bacterium]
MNRIKNIKHNVFKTISIAMFLVIFISINGFTLLPETKNETVYVNLNNDGSIKEEKTVNWLNITNSSENNNKEFIDYGDYTDIKNMVNAEKPEIESNKIIWPYDAFKSGSLFYEGTTKKELPVDISIKYALDGKEIKGEKLAGKSGNLKIEIKVINKLKQDKKVSYADYYGNDKPVEEDYYVPLMVQVSLKVDVTKFSNISADGATKVLTGKEMTVSFADFPFPESDFTMEMYGKDIELNVINIVAVPSEIPVTTDLDDTEKSLYEFDDGLIKMEDGSEDIIDGAEKLSGGLSDLKNGSNDLVNAISEINDGLGALSGSNEEITRGFSDINSALNDFNSKSGELVSATGQLSSNIVSIKNGLEQSASGASSLSGNTATLTAAMGDLKNGHSSLVAIAQLLVASNPANTTYQQLLYIANSEMDAMNSIYGGMQGISSGMGSLSTGLTSLAGGITLYKDGVDQFSSNISVLPSAFSQLTSAWSQYSNAVSDLHDGTNQLYTETQTLPDNIDKIIDGNLKIKDGIKKLKEEGI